MVPTRTPLRRRAAMLALQILLVAGAAELTLRLWRTPLVGLEYQPLIYESDASLGFRYVPGARDRIHRNFEIDGVVRINRAGFHDVEHALGDGGARVAVLGDSFVAGLQVPRSRTWTRVLESELRGIGSDPRLHVLNLGVDGTGPDRHLALLREQLPRLRPAAVVLALYENDVADTLAGRDHREVYRGHVLIAASPAEATELRARVDAHLARRTARWLHARSHLARAAAFALGGEHSLLRTNVARPPHRLEARARARGRDASAVLGPILRELADLAEERAFRLVVVALPGRRDPEASLRVLEAAEGLPESARFDPLPALRAQLAREGRELSDLYWRHDGHLNRLGHETLGKVLARELARRLAPGVDDPERRLVWLEGDARLLAPPADFLPPTPFAAAARPPRLGFAIHPVELGEERGPHWGHWGAGALHSNGRLYTAVGDHLGRGGRSYLFEFDPERSVLRRVAGLHEADPGFGPASFGFGKVHGCIDEGRDGRLYFASYGGQWRSDASNPGSRLFAYDPESGELALLGVPVPRFGAPSTRLHAASMLHYGEYQSADGPDVDFVAYDVVEGRVVFRGGHDGARHARDFFVDAAGNAYFNDGGGRLQVYDAGRRRLRPFPAAMPGPMIRRTTRPDARGRMYGVTLHEHALFRLDPARETIETLATLWTQTAALALDPTDRYLYYLAGSLASDTDGTQLVQVDLARGARQKVIAFLDRALLEEFGFRAGRLGASRISPVDGYSLSVGPDGRRILLSLNGTMAISGLERAAFLALELPDGEAVLPAGRNEEARLRHP